MNIAVRNLGVSVIVLAAAASAAHYSGAIWIAVSNLWSIYLVLAGMVATLAYKIYEVGFVKGLSERQTQQLKSIARAKVKRLWGLFALLMVAAALCKVADEHSKWIQKALTFSASAATMFFFAFVPSMWKELQDFLVEAKRHEEAIEARKAYLAAWDKQSGKT